MAANRCKNFQRRSAAPSNLDKLLTANRVIAQDNDNATPTEICSNSGLDIFALVSSTFTPFPGLSAPIDFQLFIENFLEMAKKQTTFASRTAKAKISNKLLEARNLNLYYENLHIEYYYFASNMRTILRQPGPRRINAYFLRFFS